MNSSPNQREIAVWVATEISPEQYGNAFTANGGLRGFGIGFTDEDLLYVLYPDLQYAPQSLSELETVLDKWPGLKACSGKILSALQGQNITAVNCLVAMDDYRYEGRRRKYGPFVFLGNFRYGQDMPYVGKWLKPTEAQWP